MASQPKERAGILGKPGSSTSKYIATRVGGFISSGASNVVSNVKMLVGLQQDHQPGTTEDARPVDPLIFEYLQERYHKDICQIEEKCGVKLFLSRDATRVHVIRIDNLRNSSLSRSFVQQALEHFAGLQQKVTRQPYTLGPRESRDDCLRSIKDRFPHVWARPHGKDPVTIEVVGELRSVKAILTELRQLTDRKEAGSGGRRNYHSRHTGSEHQHTLGLEITPKDHKLSVLGQESLPYTLPSPGPQFDEGPSAVSMVRTSAGDIHAGEWSGTAKRASEPSNRNSGYNALTNIHRQDGASSLCMATGFTQAQPKFCPDPVHELHKKDNTVTASPADRMYNDDGYISTENHLGMQVEAHPDDDDGHCHILRKAGAAEDSTCPICMDTFQEKTTLEKCGHIFCQECINRARKIQNKCPICGDILGELTGNQPRGTMREHTEVESLPGYESYGTIVINYHFPSGYQEDIHPNPGQSYKGTSRQAFLPDNREGREILHLLKRAFDARLLFTIGRSSTTGKENVVVWNDVHHKTSRDGGPQQYGYPDPTYFKRVRDELAAKGII